jgi:hypothetical protein
MKKAQIAVALILAGIVLDYWQNSSPATVPSFVASIDSALPGSIGLSTVLFAGAGVLVAMESGMVAA